MPTSSSLTFEPTWNGASGSTPSGRITLADYAWRWLEERPGLRPRTRELYESELRLHILPTLGQLELLNLTTSRVRTCPPAQGGATGRDHVSGRNYHVAKCYRLLHAVLGTALEDELIVKNPCVLKGTGVEHINRCQVHLATSDLTTTPIGLMAPLTCPLLPDAELSALHQAWTARADRIGDEGPAPGPLVPRPQQSSSTGRAVRATPNQK